MQIKKLFLNEREYLDYAWSIINFDSQRIWREEDLPRLRPYFDYCNHDRSDKVSKDVKDSAIFYKKCYEEYAKNLLDIRDSIMGFSREELFEFFFLEAPVTDCYEDKDGNEVDENGEIIPPISREILKISDAYKQEMVFPLTFVGWIESDRDRFGKSRVSFSEFVTNVVQKS